MNLAQAAELEEMRIRDAYNRRAVSVDPSLYSLFNPAHLAIVQERERAIINELRRGSYISIEQCRVLEIGCGSGNWLRQFIMWGLRPENLAGIDLLPDRIEEARKLLPTPVTLECGTATRLKWPSATFDVVFQSTVFSSILDRRVCTSIAKEMMRVVKPGGLILWYDFYLNNPANRNVRGVRRQEIACYFPGYNIRLRRITLAPPIARRVAPISSVLYASLAALRFLCSHYLAVITLQ